MGGAERNARKKKQAARAVTQARDSGNRTAVIAGIVVVALLAIGVIGYVVANRGGGDLGATDQKNVTAAPSVRDGAVVVVGKDTAKKTIDLYEDFLCPICNTFEKKYGAEIRKELDAGTLKVRYHMLPMLNRSSIPPGYSEDAANAGLCAADKGKFPAYYESLYAAQPEEGGPGHDKAALVKLGKDIGLTDASFEQCVTASTYNKILEDEMSRADKDPLLQRDGKFRGTPTIVSDGKVVDWQNDGWLADVLKG